MAAAFALVVLGAAGVRQRVRRRLRAARRPTTRGRWPGAPSRWRELYDQADQLLPGGADAFQQRLAELRGHPVVVNKWASWCGPCREEFPWFQRLSARLGKRIAFLGVDAKDSRRRGQGRS